MKLDSIRFREPVAVPTLGSTAFIKGTDKIEVEFEDGFVYITLLVGPQSGHRTTVPIGVVQSWVELGDDPRNVPVKAAPLAKATQARAS